MAGLSPKHFRWTMAERVACIRLDRPERKNPLTFESYAELRDTAVSLSYGPGASSATILRGSTPIQLTEIQKGWNITVQGHHDGTSGNLTYIKVMKAPED